MPHNDQSAIGQTIGRYKIIKYIASGNYGALYLGKHMRTGVEVAVKCEPKSEKQPQLPLEYRFYHEILGSHPRLPRIHYFGECSDLYHGMVMELLGPSVEKLFNDCERRFTEKTTTLLAIQFVDIIQFIHSRGVIYRDVKPENFLMGVANSPKANHLHIVDFGMAKEYRDEHGNHIPYRTDKGFLGTARYASTNAHFHKELSRRDDLEAIGHIFVYLLKGELPWQGIKVESVGERNRKIGDIKRATKPEVLCAALPQEFVRYMLYVKRLDFADDPNYEKLKSDFRQLARHKGWTDDVYDWNTKGVHK